ncbi:MAG: V-type ATPase subunit [Candidatus Woesearchaeota archaeon]
MLETITDQALLVVWGVLIAGILALIPVAIIVSKVYPYSYPNARVRAMKAKLPTNQELLELAPRSYNDIIIQLEKHYPELSKYYAADLSFSKLETALREQLITQLEKIRRISPQETKKFIEAILAKYDILDIETVTRSLATTGSVTHDVLHQTRLFSKDFISRKEHSLQDLRNELKNTVYQEILAKHYEEIQEHQLESFEKELDLFYFKKLLSTANEPNSRGYVKRLIDTHNIALINKNEEATIPGGKIPLTELQTSMNVEQLTSLTNKHGYITTASTAEQLERDMQKNLWAYAQKLLKKEPLSPASTIGLVAIQSITTRNTIILLKMKHHGFNTEEIREVLAT